MNCRSLSLSLSLLSRSVTVIHKLLQREISFYKQVTGGFMPEVIAWEDESPVLILEDLSESEWPPPWESHRVEAVLSGLREVHSCDAHVPDYGELFTHRGWHEVADSPNEFLSLGLASEEWLETCLPKLLLARDSVVTEGSALLHFDIRSDNICFRNGHAIFIDWSNACLGNPELDTAFWLPSLQLEGGPKPAVVLPDAGDLASYVTGYFASRAGRPTIPEAPWVRKLQLDQLIVGLGWVTSELGLPEPDKWRAFC